MCQQTLRTGCIPLYSPVAPLKSTTLPLIISTNNLPVHTYQPTILVTLTPPHINQQPPRTYISTNKVCDSNNSSYQPTTCMTLTILQKSLTTTSQVCLSTNLCPFYTGRYRPFWFSRFSVPKWKTSCSQPEVHFQEIFNGKKIWARFCGRSYTSISKPILKTMRSAGKWKLLHSSAKYEWVPFRSILRRGELHTNTWKRKKGFVESASHEEKRKRGLGGICWGEKFDRWGWSKQLGRVGTLKRQELEAR